MTKIDLESVVLKSGAHNSPEEGMCLVEAASLFAGEPFSDSPTCVDPILAQFARSWNDGMLSDAERAKLKKYITRLPGTNKGSALSQKRGWMALDWLIRVHTAAWLALNPGLVHHAETLKMLLPITCSADLVAAQPKLDAAKKDADAAWVAAWYAAGEAVRADAGDAALEAVRADAGDAALEAVRAAAGEAAGEAVRAAAGEAAGEAVWASAWEAVLDAVWASVWASAWEAVRAAAGEAAGEAVRAAACDAALDAVWASAWEAAWEAVRASAWASAWEALREAAVDAAKAKLEPTVVELQASAHDLFSRMILAEI
jgi:hypothetical protein